METRTLKVEMSETNPELCGKCGADIDPRRTVDFTLKNGTRVCDSCFVKETPRPTQPHRDWSN
jgi:NMD protein affecting ribosome stability and mRNA decay